MNFLLKIHVEIKKVESRLMSFSNSPIKCMLTLKNKFQHELHHKIPIRAPRITIRAKFPTNYKNMLNFKVTNAFEEL